VAVIARKIEIEILGDSRSLERAFGRAGHASTGLGRSLGALGRTAKIAIGAGVGAGIVGLGFALHASVKEFEQAQQAAAQTAAVIKSTGGVANVSAKHVTSLSNALLKKTGIDDEVIQSGENMLLTFRNIRNEVGKGNDIFDQATVAGLDMSKAMEGAGFEGGSLKTTMIRLGKALNDPVRGMTALRRVGVMFTKAQEETIKKLETTGHHMKAQKLILAELTKEFGGSAAAAGKTLPGQLTILRESLKNFGASIVAKAIPPLTDFFGWLGKIAAAPTLKLKFDLAVGGIKDFGTRIQAQIQSAVSGVDWAPIGRHLGQAIGASIVFTDAAVSRALSSLIGFMNAHAQSFADVGLTIALTMVSRLFDPGFWLSHWKILVGLASIVLLKGLGRVGGEAGLALVRGLATAPVRAVIRRIEVEFYRLPVAAQAAIRQVGRVITEGFGWAVGVVKALLGGLRAEFPKIATAIRAGFKVGAILAVIGAIQTVIRKVQDLWGWLKHLVEHVWNVKVSIHIPTPSVPGLGSSRKHDPFKGRGGATGGIVPGPRGAGDVVPMMLSPGEIILNPKQQQALGGPRYLSELFGFRGEHGPGSSMAAGGRVRRGHRAPGRVRHRRHPGRQFGDPGRNLSDPTELPLSIQEAIADAELTGPTADDLVAYRAAEAFYAGLIGPPSMLGPADRVKAKQELRSVRDTIAGLGGGGGDGSADLQAQLDQANARLGVANESARLANAFVAATGVFGGGGGGAGGGYGSNTGSGGHTFNFNSLFPYTEEQARQAAAAAAQGAGSQPYRSTSVVPTGY
jgi:hypothetical protein